MEFRFLLNKVLRRIYLRSAAPWLWEFRLWNRQGMRPKNTIDLPRARDWLQQIINPEELQKIRARAETVQKGWLHYFSRRIARDSGVFTRHPRTGRQEPLPHWSRVVINNQAGDEDIKFLWEINRIGDLDPLLVLAIMDQDQTYLTTALDILGQWESENPCNRGVNWFSNMEVAIRLLRLLFLQGVANAFQCMAPELDSLILKHQLHVQQDWRWTRRSMKGGNHLIVELAALALFESLCGKDEQASEQLRVEINRQFLADGGYFEGSLGYHLFVSNALFLVLALCRLTRSKPPFSSDCLEKPFSFVYKLTGPDGRLALIGDWDDGSVFWPIADPPWQTRFACNLGSSLIDKKAAKAQVPPDGWTAFEQSGLAAWRPKNDDLFLFRAFPVVHGHSHQDILSVVYHNENGPVIMDGGTFQYNVPRETRTYFRSPQAHSTLYADGPLIPAPLGTFGWKGALVPELQVDNDSARAAYRLPDGKRLSRELRILDKSQLLLRDRVDGFGDFVAQFLVPQVRRVGGSALEVQDLQGRPCLQIESDTRDLECEITESPVSSRYGEKGRAQNVKFRLEPGTEFRLQLNFLK